MKLDHFIIFLCKLTLLLVVTTFLVASALLVYTSYDNFCYLLLRSVNKLHRITEFQQQFVTPSTYHALQIFSVIATISVIVSILIVWHRIPKITFYGLGFIKGFYQKIIEQKNDFSSTEWKFSIIFWLIITTVNLYNCITLPISYDEAWTYLNLSSKNIFVSASYYPAPNNHILFSLFTNLTTWLPIDPKIAVRLPNLLIACLSFFLILFITKNIFYPALAVLLTILYYSLYPVMLYSTHARGYLLYILYASLLFYFFYINRSQNKKAYWYYFGLVACLGFYTIPSFLYAFTTIFLIAFLYFIWNKNLNAIKYLCIISTVSAMIVILLYVPVFLVSGIKAVTNNTYVKSKTTIEVIKLLPEHVLQTANWFTGNNSTVAYVFTVLFILVSIGICFIKNEKKILALSLCIAFVSPVIYMIVHAIIPFERTWSYLIFFWVLCIGILLYFFVSPVRIKNRLFIYGLCILVCNFFLFYRAYPLNYAIDYDTKKIANYLMLNNCHQMYINSDYQEVLIYYYYYTKQQIYLVDNGQTGKKFDKSKKYDCLILVKDTLPFTTEYYPIDLSKTIRVYLKDDN